MYFKVDDGTPVFPTHIIQAVVYSGDEEVDQERRERLSPFQVESDGIVCYSDAEKATAETTLQALGIAYTVEAQSVGQAMRDKVNGIKYASRSEALDHIQNDKLPNDPNLLRQRIENLERAKQNKPA